MAPSLKYNPAGARRRLRAALPVMNPRRVVKGGPAAGFPSQRWSARVVASQPAGETGHLRPAHRDVQRISSGRGIGVRAAPLLPRSRIELLHLAGRQWVSGKTSEGRYL